MAYAHYTRSENLPAVAVLQRHGRAPFAEVVLFLTNSDRSSNDRVRPDQFDPLIFDVHDRYSVLIGCDVSETADVSLVVGRGSVVFPERVEMISDQLGSVRNVTKDVNGESMFSLFQTCNLAFDDCRCVFALLRNVRERRRRT